ncbi:S24 family peptidase [Hoeflea alexandrii]|uniref:Helix-turn-helix domain-containing protein n=2 Tax=Hoeflea alexandrii TaxID=288436 RepID=A0ABT1CWV7_9HYPH|nr:S24 family peptidase [Hoeflea alexandrii]MCO6410071.1 helix-turn-helix domain-containing protein [Hoeflea alexandrii]
MTKTLQDRARERLAALGLSPSGASEKAGLSRETLPKLLKNPAAMPGARTLSKLATVLGVTEQWLLTGNDNPEAQPLQALRPASAPEPPSRDSMPADVPVMGTAAGSLLSGAFQLQGGVIDRVRRPPALAGARDIYALYIEGTSMEPRYFPGDLVYVNPHKPPRPGDVVIVQETNGDMTTITASIGVLRRRGGGVILLSKHNPPDSEISIRQDRVAAIHKVLTVNELFGV